MFNHDPYLNRQPQEANNCFQRGLALANKHSVDRVHWMDSEGHYYVVVPGQEWAIGDTVGYKRLTAQHVLANGTPHVITPGDIATWLK